MNFNLWQAMEKEKRKKGCETEKILFIERNYFQVTLPSSKKTSCVLI